MSKKVELKDLIIDLIEDYKEIAAKQGHIIVVKDEFTHSVLKHGRLSDARTIDVKYKSLIATGTLEKIGTSNKFLLRITDFLEKYPEVRGTINKLLAEGDRLAEKHARTAATVGKGMCERVRERCDEVFE